jgi:hypothetical protein
VRDRDRLTPIAKGRLAAEVMWTYVRVRRATRGVDLPTGLERVRAPSRRRRIVDVTPDAGARLGHAVARTLGALPADSRCLMQSLVLSAMLARRGMATTLVIGVKPGETFGAHAWVELQGIPLLPPLADQFTRLVDL